MIKTLLTVLFIFIVVTCSAQTDSARKADSIAKGLKQATDTGKNEKKPLIKSLTAQRQMVVACVNNQKEYVNKRA